MVRYTSNKASAGASKRARRLTKKPLLAIKAPRPSKKQSYDEAPFRTASQMKAKGGKTWKMVSCICKPGKKKDSACAFCFKKSHWDAPVEGKRKRERPVAYT